MDTCTYNGLQRNNSFYEIGEIEIGKKGKKESGQTENVDWYFLMDYRVIWKL